MTDLTEFLKARLDEDEDRARAVSDASPPRDGQMRAASVRNWRRRLAQCIAVPAIAVPISSLDGPIWLRVLVGGAAVALALGAVDGVWEASNGE